MHSRRMCSLVSRVALSHGQAVGLFECGRKSRLNSPVYAWPVRHCITLPKSSRFWWSSRKWAVGLSDGAIRLAIAYLPFLGVCRHSACHSFSVQLLDRRRALERVTGNGISQGRDVASFASSSARSLPSIPQWLGHHEMLIVREARDSKRGRSVWWNLWAKY